MKFYSEVTKKYYDTQDECLKAEKEIEAKKEKDAKNKKALAKVIEDAEKKLEEANKNYELAKQQALKIKQEKDKLIKELLDTAEKEIEQAETEKLNAIREFNKEYGPYQVTLTGEKASEEFKKSMDRFDKLVAKMFDSFWF